VTTKVARVVYRMLRYWMERASERMQKVKRYEEAR
jgi:hypothetical protein